MGSVPSSSQAENQSPQPGPSGYPLEVMLDEERPGPSGEAAEGRGQPRRAAAQAGSSPLPEGSSRRRKRERSAAFQESEAWQGSEEAAPGNTDTRVVDMHCGLKMRLKQRRVSAVLPEHHEAFKRLLEDPVVKRFLAWDKNLRVSDKYLLAMVVSYFSRAGLFSWQYRRIHFFIALYIESMRSALQVPAIFSFLYGKNHFQHPLFHKLQLQLIKSMGWKTWVSQEECEEIQAFDAELPVWGRDRSLLS
ncbi:speedy protein E4-like [Manis pentadactyla]|uniref:speedy protein E4-like n=1 Tax=Manis pentadactyla TaxID=143292 RepID=UPI00255C3418|nr:speedy protein E4-like [Manis pentadactyla]